MPKNIYVDQEKQGRNYAVGVQPKFNRETGEQLMSREGRPQWVIEVLMRPHETKEGTQPASEVERITVPSTKAPELAPMTPVKFSGLIASFYDIPDGPSGIALRADAVQTA